ncbi:molybdopterin-guanine dinucleotide biosynthesis protein B [Helicobacter sp. 16-1353]|uniref:molybdopterin-guanine dinucleotide biosynthesis protein B n=1 Tax=Helicobacter sp. 16-1353 TaxID=2004996 RepID=UPI000DCAEFC5|nr:molybdopterin-guanine dinucleotide biosynthesis protein B [Helicobacter sp. 16-1353]RAX54738.1 molybdopterin-guanine dinucleotide biosynthesis protein B [Helicobacter sp. 16-1353]
MTKVISFSGISNSGKTTLIEGLCKILIPNFKVGVIKHDPKNKMVFDTKGKDSYKFFESGADVAVISPSQTTIRFHQSLPNNKVLDIMNNNKSLDYLFIEGFKTMPYKRICVIRDAFVKEDVINADAIATIDSLKGQFSDKVTLDLNNHNEILDWINAIKW